MRFQQDVQTDAVMIDAAMTFEDGVMLASMNLGMKPDEGIARAEWFKKQPKPYQEKVIARVAQMQEQRSDAS